MNLFAYRGIRTTYYLQKQIYFSMGIDVADYIMKQEWLSFPYSSMRVQLHCINGYNFTVSSKCMFGTGTRLHSIGYTSIKCT